MQSHGLPRTYVCEAFQEEYLTNIGFTALFLHILSCILLQLVNLFTFIKRLIAESICASCDNYCTLIK